MCQVSENWWVLFELAQLLASAKNAVSTFMTKSDEGLRWKSMSLESSVSDVFLSCTESDDAVETLTVCYQGI